MTEIGQSTGALEVRVPSTGASVGLAWGAATDRGHRRAVNEDSYIARGPVFAVADGMGGHASGDLASAAVVARLAELAGRDFAEISDVESALAAATDDITAIAGDTLLGVGTTVTGAVLVLEGDTPAFAVFNVGDSRVYIWQGGELAQVTVDHSVVQEMVDAGALTRGEADQHPDSNIITRAIGFNARPVPDFWTVPLERGMRLLVCSDGLTKEVGDPQLHEALAAERPAEATAAALIDAALAAGGRDNVTVLVVDVTAAPDLPVDDDTAPRGSHRA